MTLFVRLLGPVQISHDDKPISMRGYKPVATIQSRLDETVFATAWAEGGAMTQEQAIDYALAIELE